MRRLSTQPNTDAKTEKRTFLSSNPVMRRLNKVDESAVTDSATYAGIIGKTVYFLLFTVAGIILQLILAANFATGETFALNYKGFEVTMYTGEAIALTVSVVLAIVFQLLAFFARGTTPVTGALYCVTQGYFISFLIFKVLNGYEYLGVLALGITMCIILVMAILYAKGVIRVTQKFRTVMMTLFITVIAASVLTLLGSLAVAFLPVPEGIKATFLALRNNIFISIGFSVLFIIIASLFLICDFATIDHVVNDHLPKKYEWQAAFGLSFTVLWLYLKVLELIITIAGRKRS